MNPSVQILLMDAALAEPLRIVLAIWTGFLGGCIGSFMNVVVYRLPLRKSLVYPGSACPACGNAIRWYHNIPVLGWLMLRGRCYDCGLPIAARYPIVEAIVAGIFVIAALAGPLATDHLLDDGALLIDPLEWGALGYRLLLVCVLLCLALIELDTSPEHDMRFVRRMEWGTAIVGVVLPLVWPELLAWRPETIGQSSLDALVVVLSGAAGGFLLGWTAWPATGLGPSGAAGHRRARTSLVLVGIFLGLPLVCVAAALAACGNLVLMTWPRPRGAAQLPWSLALVAVTVVAVLAAGANADWLRLQWNDAGLLLVASMAIVYAAAAINRAWTRVRGA